MKKRILAALLAAVLVIGLFPVTALAAEGDTTTELPKLDAPSELTWGKEVYYNSDGEKIEIDDPRFVSWKTNAPVNCGATVTVFHKGTEETEFTKIDDCDVEASNDDQLWEYNTRWIWHTLVNLVNADNYGDPIPGTYKFTVQLHADGYQDSDVVESAEWTYADPGSRLDNPPTLIWDDDSQTVTWAEDVGDAQMFCVEVRIYYSDSKLEGDSLNEQNLEIVESLLFRDDKVISNLREDVFEKEGYYYARVKSYTADYNVIKDSEWSEYGFLLHYVDTRTQLPTPIDLKWDRFWYQDNEGNVQAVEVPLCMSWTFEEGALDDLPQEIYMRTGIFQVNDDPDGEDQLIAAWNARYEAEYGYDDLYYYGLYKGEELDLQTGKYYFDVWMETDDPDFKDGDLARSPVLEYTRPDAKLTAPGKLVGAIDDAGDFSWKGTWDETEHRDKGYHFEFEYYYSADNGEATSVEELTELPGHSYGDTDEDDALYTNLWVQHMEEETLKPGYYYCRVQATSKDIKTVLNSDWSELSAGTYLYPLVENMIEVDLSDETYTGKPITKKITIKAGDKTLVEGTDYTVEYANNTNVSTGDTKAEIQIIGKGIYSGGNAFYYTFTIKAKSTGGGGGGSPSGGGSTGGGSSKPVEPENPPVEPENPPVEPETPVTHASEKFSDVAKDSWYEAGVTYVTDKGLFQGLSEGVFAPDTNMTRAMLMTVLARLDGQETSGGATWYAKAMDWAKAQGISDGSAPDGSVTREQLVTMLYRYAKPEKVEGGLDGFGDKDEVSAWAKEAMEWAVANGIVTGKGGARLDPQGTATRAEVATIIQRFAEKTEQ